MKALISILSMFLLIPAASYAQGEYDDLYYTPEDRETERKNYQAQVSQTNFKSSNIEDYEITTPSITSDRIYSTSQGRTVNPEYVAQYRSRAEARKQSTQQDEEVYFDENYSADYYEDDQQNARVVNNYNYYGDSWANPYYDPFYVNDWRWRYNDWRWRRSSWYHDPYWSYAPGWSVHVSIGFGNHWGWGYGHRWSRWSYDPWYSPYYAGGFYYDSFYNPYWSTPVYSNVLYNNVVYVNNNYENNNRTVRRGPGTSRGSVITGRRSSVADSGPVTRVPVRRSSSADGDTNGRVSSPATSGRVIDRTGAATRSPRSYDNVEDGYTTRSTRTGVQPATRSINTRSTTPVRGTSVERTRPTRGTYTAPTRNTSSPSRTYTPSRSNNNREYTPSRSNNNRQYTPSRSNTRSTPPARNNSRTTTPSRRGGNDQSYTPSRSNSRSSGYSAPQQRSSQPSYNRSSSGSSSRSSSVTPSRSSSSSSGTRSSSGSRSSSSRRGGN